MILELDCGNSLIKWRVLAESQLVTAQGVVQDSDELLAAVVAEGPLSITFVRVVSVRSEEEVNRLVDLLRLAYKVEVAVAAPARVLAGVVNGYEEYQRLGLDRWLALVAAYKRSSGAVLVIDLGTAITSDFVGTDGFHRGGFICPGLPLMRSQLRTHTRKIRYSDDEGMCVCGSSLPGRSTAEAVERGCLHMVRGFVADQVSLATELLGDFDIYLTGGDAAMVSDLLPRARVCSDLVFAGLALACPYERG